MPYKQNAPQILDKIHNSNHILLLSHEKPDGDTLGAGLALSHYLEKIGKKHKHYCPDQPPAYFGFLPKIENLITDFKQIDLADHDLIITLDCGDLKRTSLEVELLAKKDTLIIINIDHHQSNNLFGHYNLVAPNASSASEIIYKFFDFHKISLDKYMATNLLTGILTDTTNFTNAATTQDSLKIAAHLLQAGARVNQIVSQISQNKNLPALKLWGKVLSRLEYNQDHNYAYTIITLADLEESQITADEAGDGLANFLSNINDVEFIMVLTEQKDGFIKGSLRTVKDNVDVAKLAESLGGGGHKKAAGFKVQGQLTQSPQGWKII